MASAVKAFGLSSYRMREAVRVGGLCQAYLAESLETPGMGPLIIKQLLPAFSGDAHIAARWLDQAEANAALDHPGCLRVIDWGWADGTGHMVVPLIPGTSLKQLLRGLRAAKREVPPEVALYVTRAVLSALAYAHEYVPPMCHLDVSPYSVLIRPDATVLVTEFGMWSALPLMDAARVRFERGRAHYLSPEVARSQPADVRADVFSAGVMLYELLLGERPFSGTTQLVVAMAIAEGKRKPVSEHPRAARLSPELCAVVEHMIAHDPAQRFQTARAALNALSSASTEDPHARGKLAELVPHAAAPERGPVVAAPEVAPSVGRPQVKTAFFRGRAGKGGASTGAGAGAAGVARPTLRAQPELEAPPPIWAVMDPPPRAPGEHSTARVRAVKPLAESPIAAPTPSALTSAAAPAVLEPPTLPFSAPHVSRPPALMPPPMIAPAGPGVAVQVAARESVAPPPMLPVASPGLVSVSSAAGSASPRGAGLVPWSPAASGPALAVDVPPMIAPNVSSNEAFVRAEPSTPSAVSESSAPIGERPDLTPLPALRFEPLAQAQEAGRWRDPSHTLFQMKRYAEGETPKQGSRVPLPVAVALAVVFGFAVVAGGYLLFRLAT